MQFEAAVDVVAPASAIRAEGGCLVLDGTVPVLGEDGVTMTAGRYRPAGVCDAGIAGKLGIPAGYLKRMRAWLSDGRKTIDHLDPLMAVFDGIRASGQQVSIDSCDLTGRRMYVRVRCEAVQVLAPALLAGYRSPVHRSGRG